MKRIFLLRSSIIPILLLTFLVYANSLQNKFVWDDLTFIVKWPVIRHMDFGQFMSGVLPEKHQGVYRPLRSVFYAASYKLWGLNEHYYKFQSILLHVLGTYAVFLLVRSLSGDRSLSILTALMFGVHPVHTESVDFTAASFDMSASVLLLFSVYFFHRHLIKGRAWFMLVSLLLGAAAILTGESALPLPALMVIVYIYFRGKNRKLSILRTLSPFFVLTAVYVFVRVYVLKILARGEFDFYKTVVIWIFMFRALYRYITVMFFPYLLTVDYEVGRRSTQIVISKTAPFWLPFMNGKFVAGVFLLMISLYLGVRWYRKHRLASFSIWWFYIGLTPFLNILPVNAGVSERYLYLSSFGFCLGVTSAVVFFYRKFLKERASLLIPRSIIFAYTVVIVLLAGRTIIRNADWRDSYTLWKSTVETTPSSGIAHNNLGREYARRKEYDRALMEFVEVLRIAPNRPHVYSNLGKTYLLMGAYKESKEAFESAVKSDELDYDAYIYLSQAHQKLGNREEAKNVLLKGLEKIKHAKLYNALAFLYLSESDHQNAKRMYIEALRTYPDDPLSYNNLAVLNFLQGDIEEGIKLSMRSVYLYPDDPEPYFNLAEAYKKKGEMAISEKYYREAVRREPGFEKAKTMMGEFEE